MSVGASTARFDALAKTRGQAEYPADRVPADALIAKVVFSGQAHARMTATLSISMFSDRMAQ